MRLYSYLLTLFVLSLALAACPVVREMGDDDDNVDDDDSAEQPVDDDDVLADDDDVLADDDDAGDDDDDVQPDDDDTVLDEGIATVDGSWFFGYLIDTDGDGQGDADVCQQHYEFGATIEFGPNAVGATCPMCVGHLQVSSVSNVTETSTEIDTPCVPSTHFGEQQDMGEILTNAAYGMADFLHPQALIDVDTMLDVAPGSINGLDPSVTPAYLQGIYADAGVQLTHFGFLTDVDGGFFQTVGEGGLAAVAVSPPNVVGYLPFFTYYNGPGGLLLEMNGQYGIGGLWSITWTGAASYHTVTFSGAAEASFTAAP